VDILLVEVGEVEVQGMQIVEATVVQGMALPLLVVQVVLRVEVREVMVLGCHLQRLVQLSVVEAVVEVIHSYLVEQSVLLVQEVRLF